ncbi:MAG: glycosyltransferase family 4 protein [Candidatus Omnitrophica bacterium]|nr:glycosyltransferase family 4 protein [Candidatus Omnitrophota bacterium]
MKILFLTNHLNIGGVTSYCLTLGEALKERGNRVYIASSGGELLFKFIEAGIDFVPIPIRTKKELSPKVIFSAVKLLRTVRDNKIDIVHSNSRTTQVLGCLLKRYAGVTHVHTCHGFFKRRLHRRLFPCWGKKVIAISEQVKEHLIRDFRVKADDIRVIHNGIDADRFRPNNAFDKRQAKINLGLGSGPVIGIIGRLSDVKGHIFLVEAMGQVLRSVPSAQLVIVGEGRMKEGLISRARELGIEDSVYFLPAVSDTRPMLQLMDIFCMPSLEEGLGLSLMEAMASGLAVVGSDIGGIKTLIRDGLNGLLVPPQDAESLGLAIVSLLEDERRRLMLAAEAREFIVKSFSCAKMAEETQKVYLECLGAKA